MDYGCVLVADEGLLNWKHRILFDFQRTENAKNPGSVNATYILTGVQKSYEANGTQDSQDRNGNETLQSSPFMDSSQPSHASSGVQRSSIILAREGDLDGNTFLPFPFSL